MDHVLKVRSHELQAIGQRIINHIIRDSKLDQIKKETKGVMYKKAQTK